MGTVMADFQPLSTDSTIRGVPIASLCDTYLSCDLLCSSASLSHFVKGTMEQVSLQIREFPKEKGGTLQEVACCTG